MPDWYEITLSNKINWKPKSCLLKINYFTNCFINGGEKKKKKKRQDHLIWLFIDNYWTAP